MLKVRYFGFGLVDIVVFVRYMTAPNIRVRRVTICWGVGNNRLSTGCFCLTTIDPSTHTNEKMSVAETKEGIEKVEAKIEGVEAKIKGVEAKIEGVEAKIEGVEAKIEDVETKIKNEKDTEEKKALRRKETDLTDCLLYTSPSPRDRTRSRMPSSA